MSELIVERMDHVTVNVVDIERGKKYYGGLLGLKEIPRPASFTFPGAWYDLGNLHLHLVVRAEPEAPSSRHFALWTKDVRAAARVIEAAGYEVRWDKFKIPGVDRFFTRDPDGNSVEVQGRDA